MNPHSFDCLPHQVDHILDCLPHQVDHILTVDTTSDAPACHYLCAECSRRFRTLRGFQRHSDFRRSRGRCPQAADGPVSPAKTSPPPGGNLGGNLGGSPPPGGSPPHRAWDRADLGGNLEKTHAAAAARAAAREAAFKSQLPDQTAHELSVSERSLAAVQVRDNDGR